ncbi:MAG TPA: hypothetical protein PKE52_01090 [Bacteroidales bacterium]|jgi:hypothetical protein|nr:hypothetical protein [Bacteroidales bacterium]
MQTKEQALTWVNPLMKMGVIGYLAMHAFQLGYDPGFELPFWNGFVQVIIALVFVALSIIVVALKRRRFYVLGFFLVFVGSLYISIDVLSTQSGFSRLPIQFLLITISLYFLAVPARSSSH